MTRITIRNVDLTAEEAGIVIESDSVEIRSVDTSAENAAIEITRS